MLLSEWVGQQLPHLFVPCLLAAFTRFSEAILSYVANIDRAPNKKVTVERFAQVLVVYGQVGAG